MNFQIGNLWKRVTNKIKLNVVLQNIKVELRWRKKTHDGRYNDERKVVNSNDRVRDSPPWSSKATKVRIPASLLYSSTKQVLKCYVSL